MLDPFVWFVVHATAAEWTVAQDGSGDFATVTDAMTVAGAGDTVTVRAGTYSPDLGESPPWYFPTDVTLRCVDRDQVTLDAGDWWFGDVVGAGVVIEGCTFAGAGWNHALGVQAYADVTIRTSRFADNDVTAIDANLATLILDDVEFVGNRDAAYESAISAYSTCIWADRVTIDDEATTRPLAMDAAFPSGDDGGCNTWNRLRVTGSAVSLSGLVSNSVFVGARGHGSTGARKCVSNIGGTMENSVVVGCSSTERVLYTNVARNNLVAFNDGIGIDALYYAASNLSYENADGNWGDASWAGLLGNIEADPLFRDFSDDGDWTNDDLRLQERSPAIDAGVADFPPYDANGVPRPQDGDGDGIARADIGAYEWGEFDADGDGWFLDGGDCDDNDADINPGEVDIPYNGIDEDCDGEDATDYDGDGHDADHQGGDDCDDTDAAVHPGAYDVAGNGVDEDCDGADAADADGDGWGTDLDCDDTDGGVNPGADELCNGTDDDCDGAVDEDGVCTEDTGIDVSGRTCGCGCRGDGDSSIAVVVPLLAAVVRRRRVVRSPAA